MRFLTPLFVLTCLAATAVIPAARAQDNYEIQVYSYDTVEPGKTMVELHSNFIPKKWNCRSAEASPMKSAKRRPFSTDTWTWEIAPSSTSKSTAGTSLSTRLLTNRCTRKPCRRASSFLRTSRSATTSSKKSPAGSSITVRVGPATDFLSSRLQMHQFFPAIDLNLSPKWEGNFGLGVGVTASTDHLIAKMILGYRFDF